MKFVYIIISIICTCLTISAQPLTLEFKHVVGNKPLVLHDSAYINTWNEEFVVHKFKYYITDVTLYYHKGTKIHVIKDYFLIDEEDSLSKQITLISNLKDITAINFVVGVDSVTSNSGVQTNNLDPLKGMFWTWNTGYVFAKLEGQSPQSTAPGKYFSYHVGGYKQGENAIKKISLTVMPSQIHGQTIVIKADVLAWFKGNEEVHIHKTPICHQPGNLALQIAANYSKMFSIE